MWRWAAVVLCVLAISIERIREIQETLELLYEQRNALEKGALLTPDDGKDWRAWG